MILADADLVIITALKAAITDRHIGTEVPYDFTGNLPFATVRRFSGAAVDPRFYDRATVSADTWGNSRADAYTLAADIREALLAAATNQTVYPGAGYIARFSEITAPSELRVESQPDNVWRFQATYSLFVRPDNS